jgi:polar amino acid transport system substrate-binding protein
LPCSSRTKPNNIKKRRFDQRNFYGEGHKSPNNIQKKEKAMKKSALKVLVALVLVGLLASTGSAADSLIDKVLKRGVLKVGVGLFVPVSFKDKDGNLVGCEIEMAKKLAKDIGVKAVFVPTEWSGIIPALLTGKFDVIIGGMGITPQRALKVNFSIPYRYSGMDCIVNKKLLPGITTLEELNNKDVIISVVTGATPAIAAKKITPKAQLHQFPEEAAVLQDLLNGNAHAVFASWPKPGFWEIDYPAVLYRPLGGELFTHEPICFAVKKGDHDTLSFFNSWILQNEDWLKERITYWFDTKEWGHLVPN